MASSSKNLFLLLGILLVFIFVISTQVQASRDETTESVEVDGHHGGRGHGFPGKGHGGGGGYPGHGGGKGGGYPGKGCRHGCCRGYRYNHGCKRCCGNAQEAPDAQFEDDSHN